MMSSSKSTRKYRLLQSSYNEELFYFIIMWFGYRDTKLSIFFSENWQYTGNTALLGGATPHMIVCNILVILTATWVKW